MSIFLVNVVDFINFIDKLKVLSCQVYFPFLSPVTSFNDICEEKWRCLFYNYWYLLLTPVTYTCLMFLYSLGRGQAIRCMLLDNNMAYEEINTGPMEEWVSKHKANMVCDQRVLMTLIKQLIGQQNIKKLTFQFVFSSKLHPPQTSIGGV